MVGLTVVKKMRTNTTRPELGEDLETLWIYEGKEEKHKKRQINSLHEILSNMVPWEVTSLSQDSSEEYQSGR